MPWDEIEVPKELREFMLGEAEETFLGQKNDSIKQYRYGNLHIREYEDKFLVHTDKIDPRENPLGHLIYDAPEVLVGLACAFFGGSQLSNLIYSQNKSKKNQISTKILSSLIAGYLGFTAAKKLKNNLG